jgi:hypothetical protein
MRAPRTVPRAPFTRALGKVKAFKAEAGWGAACLWHFTRALGKVKAFKAEAGWGAVRPWHFTRAFPVRRAIITQVDLGIGRIQRGGTQTVRNEE